MRRLLAAVIGISCICAATVPAATVFTQTNVLQNVSVLLTMYQQGATNARKVSDKVVSFNTKALINALAAATGQNFGTSPKLVLSTVYSNIVVTSGNATFTNGGTNTLTVSTTNNFFFIGATEFFPSPSDIYTINGNVISDNGTSLGTVSTNVVRAAEDASQFVAFSTNTGAVTTISPITNGGGQITSYSIVSKTQIAAAPTLNVFTNIGSSVDVLYGGNNNFLYPITNYISFSTNSPEVVVQTGLGLDTPPLAVSNLISQSGFSIQGLQINCTGPTNLILSLQGFVRDTLKVDVFSVTKTNRIVADVFGANATWSALGSGYIGGTVTTNATNAVPFPLLGNYLGGSSPVVVQGSVSITFLKNLPQ